MSSAGPQGPEPSPRSSCPSELITVLQLSGAFHVLRAFLSDSQYKALALESLLPDRGPLWSSLMATSQCVSALSRIGEQAARGADAFVYLHYRKRAIHWFVLEGGDPSGSASIDIVCYTVNPESPGLTQRQRITTQALKCLGAELDLDFYPCAFREIESAGVSFRPEVSVPRDRSGLHVHGRPVA